MKRILGWACLLVVCVTSLPAKGQQLGSGLPVVTMMAPPTYPVFARQAHVEGVVRLKITTDGRRVADAEVQGSAPAMLEDLAEKNVRTWEFEPADPTSFIVSFTYKLVTYRISGADRASVTLKLPTDVEISATMPVNVDLAPDKRD